MCFDDELEFLLVSALQTQGKMSVHSSGTRGWQPYLGDVSGFPDDILF